MTTVDVSLDSILAQLGEFGRYQRFVFVLLSLAVILHSVFHIAFVFSTKDIEYRCEIPQCELSNNTNYEPDWLHNAVPYKDDKPKKCDKYYYVGNGSESCYVEQIFDTSTTEKCSDFIYKGDEVTIVQDFDLQCDDNTWKLTMVGTINNFGQFVGMMIAGIIADRYGRRTVLVMGMVLAALAGIGKSFSPNYITFVFLEFLDATLGSGTYACGFTLAVELVGPSKRVLSGTIICCTYAIGEVIVALLAWWLQDWRSFILACYIPPLLLISYFWLTPESVRWLLSRGRLEEAQHILRKAAKVNNKAISEDSLQKLAKLEEPTVEVRDPMLQVFKSTPLLLRFINCCFCWITCTFLFYGLTLNSVALAGNSYLDFIYTSLVEIPAYFTVYLTVDRWGRRSSQCVWFLLTGFSCIGFIFASDASHWLQLSVYLLGKFGATAAFTVMYVITSEIFPTPLRQSLMGACSMFGRIGSMVSPQMPLLSNVWDPLPLVLFATMAMIAGLLSLLFPETLNTKLPDTIEEAENIGREKPPKGP